MYFARNVRNFYKNVRNVQISDKAKFSGMPALRLGACSVINRARWWFPLHKWKNFKEKAFVKSTASVRSEKLVGALASWYNWKGNSDLTAEKVEKHEFIDVKCYRRTISS